ncbi:WW domain-containing oxidoreductase isoform X2 [Chelonus insularis]|uniref:WW domain-containing oxidoreductase isoform X2 n=1 Tax=Chelonus insularis TaxID=460826 RepID=UPI00158C81FC|nr:WW domain-containing oxidoreductase isoform X2 [Chelonus insularis]
MVGILNESDSDDDLPPGWEERATVDGNVYYVNHYTKGTQWTHPRTGRKKIVEGDDGKILFVNHLHRTTTYTDPRLAFATEYREASQPVRQRFDASSSALAVLHGRDLRGKVALITGANTGIGFETARSLAFHGCTVVMACRNLKKTEEAIQRIKKERENVSCEALQCDLSSLHSIKNAAEKFKQKYRTLHILILNAGVFGLPYTLTEDGYETIFQVNYLSHYYLTLLLEHPLRSCSNSRIVIVSSESHRFSTIQNVEDIHPLTLSPPAFKFWSMGAYNDSKLCNVLFAQELAKRWPSVSVFSCHPGNMVSSELSRYCWMYRLLFAAVRPFTKSLQQAASTPVFCATAPELEGTTGIYLNNCYRCEVSNAAKDSDLAARLWNVSQEMIINVVKRDKLWYELALK